MNIELTIEPRIIAALKHIASKDECRPVLTGISLRCLEGKATACHKAKVRPFLPLADTLNGLRY